MGRGRPKGSIADGRSKTLLFQRWQAMLKRTRHNPLYTRRGITVCPAWSDWVAFRDWAISAGYIDGLSLDRIDNDAGYEPDNCRWVTKAVQDANRRPASQWALPQRKIEHSQYPAIWRLRQAGLTLAAIGAEYDCSEATIHRIVHLQGAS